ncbi:MULTISPECIES: hypothetical protein [unclassified Streptomyces]|uniref:hypothetical protein n=1 Tax=unclassified Streptomyces TaxID=2593676 RepID=UPI003403674B
MEAVSVTTENGKTTVRSPYHPGWPSEARALGGKWNAAEKAWVFDARDEERVRQLARDTYGTDGTPDPAGTVSVQIPVLDVQASVGQPATLWQYGRTIATRFGRDEEPRLGEGVVLISGGFKQSAGSHRYIHLGPVDDEVTIVEVRDMPRSVAIDHNLKIVGEDKPDREALKAERERLTARITEIDTLLNGA